MTTTITVSPTPDLPLRSSHDFFPASFSVRDSRLVPGKTRHDLGGQSAGSPGEVLGGRDPLLSTQEAIR